MSPLQKIGKYEVLEVLGQGGMGIVYRAIDPGIGRQVAIKMMTGGFAENPDLLKRFQREAQSAGSLQHRNIVIIYELGTHENGNPYMAMEFLSGESLESIISSRKPMSLVDKLDVMIQVLQGLHYAHEHGIVHRDIKPANIMVLKDGTVKIVDFGIARISDNSMTKAGQIVGTINYMSPEQFKGHGVDGRSDIFSAGVMLYEFLTGILPFDAHETPTVMLKILNDPPPPLSDHLASFPPELEECVKRALAKERDERYGTAEDFAFDLSHIAEALKKEMVVGYVDLARQALEKRELTRAKDLLQQVLKAESKHALAQELMKQVQSQLSVQQRGEQAVRPSSGSQPALRSDLDTRRDELLAKDAVEKAIKDAKALLLARQISAANRTLQQVAHFVPQTPPEVQKAYASAQKDVARTGIDKQQIDADMNATMVAGSTGRGSGTGTAVVAQKNIGAVAPVPVVKSFPTKQAVIGLIAVVVIVGGWFGYQKMIAPPVVDTYIEINATPWATVVSVDSIDGKLHYPVGEETPVRVPVPSGNFHVTLKTPSGETVTETSANLSPSSPGIINKGLEIVDPDEIVKSSN